MPEFLDILDENQRSISKIASKSEVHKKGYYHNTAHVWFYTNTGEILLQQRSASKIICPLLWDVSVAGHVDAGETIEQAAIRETKEEIGVIIHNDQLQAIGVFNCFQDYDNGVVDNEFHNTFICQLNSTIEQLEPNPTEVESLKLVTITVFEDLLKNSHKNGHFIAHNTPYYLKVLQAIRDAIKN